MIKYSIFGVVSFFVYIFGMVESSQKISSRFIFILQALDDKNTVTSIKVDNLQWLVWSLFTLFAVRIYLHVWIIDESHSFNAEAKNESKLKLAIEWLLRLYMVTAIAILPVSLAQNCNVFVMFNSIPPFSYILSLGLCLIAWALLMFSTIKKYSSKKPKELIIFWIGIDSLIVLCCIILALGRDFNILDMILPKNWGPFYEFFSINIILIASFIQLVYWVPAIFIEAKQSKIMLSKG